MCSQMHPSDGWMLSHVSCLWNPCLQGLCHTKGNMLGLSHWHIWSPKGCVNQLAWNIYLWNHLNNFNIFKVQIWYHLTWMLIRSCFKSSFLFTEHSFKIPFDVFIHTSFPEFSNLGGVEGTKIVILDFAYHCTFCDQPLITFGSVWF